MADVKPVDAAPAADKPVESVPAAPAETVQPVAPAVPEKPAEVPVVAPAVAAPEAAADKPVDAKVEEQAPPVPPKDDEPKTEEAAPAVPEKGAEDVTEGSLLYQASSFPKNLLHSKRHVWLGDKPVAIDNLAQYLRGEKAAVANPIAAWSSQTGKGLLYFVKHAENKSAPVNVLPMADATDFNRVGSEFSFKVDGARHSFQSRNETEAQGWVAALKKASEEAKAVRPDVEASEAYKASLEQLAKAFPVKETESKSKERSTTRSQSSKRQSILGIWNKDKAEATSDDKTEDKAAETAKPEEEAKAEEPKEEEKKDAEAKPEEAKAEEKAEEKEDETKAKANKRASIFDKFRLLKLQNPVGADKEEAAAAETKAESVEEKKEDEVAAKPEEAAIAADPVAAAPVPAGEEKEEAKEEDKAEEKKEAKSESTTPKAKDRKSFFFTDFIHRVERKDETKEDAAKTSEEAVRSKKSTDGSRPAVWDARRSSSFFANFGKKEHKEEAVTKEEEPAKEAEAKEPAKEGEEAAASTDAAAAATTATATADKPAEEKAAEPHKETVVEKLEKKEKTVHDKIQGLFRQGTRLVKGERKHKEPEAKEEEKKEEAKEEAKTEEKAEEKAEAKTEEKAEEKTEDKTEKKEEEKPAAIGDVTPEAVSVGNPQTVPAAA